MKNFFWKHYVSILVIVGILTIVYVDILPIHNKSRANDLMENFPTEIAGASKIEKFSAKDATDVIIHVRQTHDGKNITPELMEQISKIQDDIYQILSKLIESYPNGSIYDEGRYDGIEAKLKSKDKFKDFVRENKSTDSIIDKLRAEVADYEKQIEYLKDDAECYKKSDAPNSTKGMIADLREILVVKKKLEETKNNLNDLIKAKFYDLSATRRLERDKKIEIKSPETKFSNRRAAAIMDALEKAYKGEKGKKAIDDPLFAQVIQEEREDLALSLMAQDNSAGPKVIVFGAAHDFTNNIGEWNSIKGNKKFALIVITPNSYVPSKEENKEKDQDDKTTP